MRSANLFGGYSTRALTFIGFAGEHKKARKEHGGTDLNS